MQRSGMRDSQTRIALRSIRATLLKEDGLPVPAPTSIAEYVEA